jgi:murein DD-endopeptidase MepM/ murein hydrolase activator NlpD
MPGPVRNPAEAYQQLEAIMLRQMLQSSGAFRATSTPGSQLRTDMFVETLADAVAKAGGLGIARMLEHQLGGDQNGKTDNKTDGKTAAGSHRSGNLSLLAPGRGASLPGISPSTARVGAIDDLDDPNSEAPLPEDPSADSIDDYQTKSVGHSTSKVHLPVVPVSDLGADGQIPHEVTGLVTSGFGQRIHPVSGESKFHTGVDLRAAEGAPIRAAANGVIRDAGRRGGYGNVVEIDHGNGTSTLYAHASALLVAKGQRIDEGQPIALVGQTGQATGPHLHFELRRNDHPVNPTSTIVPTSITRALNRYRERVEIPGAGTPFSAGTGEKQ